MKILYCTDQLFLHGGIEKITTNKLNYLSSISKYEIYLCTSQQMGNSFIYPLNREVNHFDLKIKYNRKISYFSIINLLKIFSHYVKFFQLCFKIKPDIIISVNNTPEQYFIPLIPLKFKSIKEFHSSGYNLNSKLISDFKTIFLNKLLGLYTLNILLNEDEVKYYEFRNFKIIPNFIKITNNNLLLPKEKVIISAGRLAPIKQFEHIIEAWSKIERSSIGWRLEIYGDGDEVYINQLQNLITLYELKNIKVLPGIKNIHEKFLNASIFVLSSKSDCFPMVLIEAMAAGMGIVSYDCPNGPRNILQDKYNGYLVEQDNIENLANKLKLLIDDPQLLKSFQINSLEKVNTFNQDKIMQIWENVFNELI
jgi:glycosyltransferase involved in cell wall biosynthesis